MSRVRITSRNRPLFRRRVAVDLVRFTDAIAATQRNERFGLTRSHEDIGDSKRSTDHVREGSWRVAAGWRHEIERVLALSFKSWPQPSGGFRGRPLREGGESTEPRPAGGLVGSRAEWPGPAPKLLNVRETQNGPTLPAAWNPLALLQTVQCIMITKPAQARHYQTTRRRTKSWELVLQTHIHLQYEVRSCISIDEAAGRRVLSHAAPTQPAHEVAPPTRPWWWLFPAPPPAAHQPRYLPLDISVTRPFDSGLDYLDTKVPRDFDGGDGRLTMFEYSSKLAVLSLVARVCLAESHAGRRKGAKKGNTTALTARLWGRCSQPASPCPIINCQAVCGAQASSTRLLIGDQDQTTRFSILPASFALGAESSDQEESAGVGGKQLGESRTNNRDWICIQLPTKGRISQAAKRTRPSLPTVPTL